MALTVTVRQPTTVVRPDGTRYAYTPTAPSDNDDLPQYNNLTRAASTTTRTTSTPAMPDYRQAGFTSPEAYAAEIMRKEATGATFTNKAAADAFRAANPNLFPGASVPPPMPAALPKTAATTPGATGLAQNMSPEVSKLLSQLKSYLGGNPSSMQDVMDSDAYRDMSGAIDTQAEQAMRAGRADLAARGVLGAGSTPAAEKYAQIAGEQAALRGALVPQLMNASNSQYQQGFGNLLSMLGAQSGQEQTGFNNLINMFNTLAPYQYLTEAQRQQLPLDWTQVIGSVPGSTPGAGGNLPSMPTGSGALVPARDYVTSHGGTIRYDTRGGRDIVTINGKEIDVAAVGGSVVGGRAQLPQWVLDTALGVS
jgi:hypothetical protein